MKDMDTLDGRAAWSRLSLALIIAVIGNVGMWSIVVLMPGIADEFGADRATASLPYTALMLGFAFGNLAIGWLVDRSGLALALALAALAVGGGLVASAFSPGIVTLVIAQALVGFGTAATFGPLIADISLWFLRRRGIAVSIAASGNYLSGAIWPVLLTGPMGALDWRASSLVIAAIVVGTVLPLSYFMRARIPQASLVRADAVAAERKAATGLSPRTLIWLLGIAGIGCCTAMAMPQVHIVALCVDLGFGALVGGQMLSLMLAGGVVSRLVSG
ncbi:MAG: MFS transporter, partial [Pseudomonadota bacterium]